MQKLHFEAAWDKTISPNDRREIEKIFEDTKEEQEKMVSFVKVRQAENHKKELLVTVLVHNFGDSNLTFKDRKIVYLENNQIKAEHTFSLPLAAVPPNTSMPWTFIFPKESLCGNSDWKDGYLQFR